MAEREFTLSGEHAITCNDNCGGENAVVLNSKVKGFEGKEQLFRCVAKGAAFRGQHYPSNEDHLPKLSACRVCILQTNAE